MSYLIYLCLFACSDVQRIALCCFVFVWLRLVSCMHNNASFSGLSILEYAFGLSNVYYRVQAV